MLEKLRLKRTIKEEISIGDVINVKDIRYVVIQIIEITPARLDLEAFYFDCLCQQVQTPDLSAEYMTTQAEIVYSLAEYDNISEVGEFIFDDKSGIWIQIDAILNVRFEGTNMYVKYEFTPVVEWSDEEINEAITNERKKSMKLLRSKNQKIN